MKTREIEKMLEEQLTLRLDKLEDDQDAVGRYKLSDQEYAKLQNEIIMIDTMRKQIHADRLDRIQKYVDLGVRTVVPAVVTVALSVLGYGLEGLFGNACSRTLQEVLKRSPKM